MTDALDSRSFGVLVELREQLGAALPLQAHGHTVELADPDAVGCDAGQVWAELRYRPTEHIDSSTRSR